jgi:response regulator RpfG family c-di-GMP phosphodiesterase
MALQRLLEEEGASIFTTRSVSQALQLVATRALSAAIVDIRLGAEEADPLCEALGQRHVPFLFYTGQPDTPSERWPAARVIETTNLRSNRQRCQVRHNGGQT